MKARYSQSLYSWKYTFSFTFEKYIGLVGNSPTDCLLRLYGFVAKCNLLPSNFKKKIWLKLTLDERFQSSLNLFFFFFFTIFFFSWYSYLSLQFFGAESKLGHLLELFPKPAEGKPLDLRSSSNGFSNGPQWCWAFCLQLIQAVKHFYTMGIFFSASTT